MRTDVYPHKHLNEIWHKKKAKRVTFRYKSLSSGNDRTFYLGATQAFYAGCISGTQIIPKKIRWGYFRRKTHSSIVGEVILWKKWKKNKFSNEKYKPKIINKKLKEKLTKCESKHQKTKQWKHNKPKILNKNVTIKIKNKIVKLKQQKINKIKMK